MGVIVHLLALVLTLFLVSFFLFVHIDMVGVLLATSLAVLVALALLRRVQSNERRMATFLECIAHEDFTTTAFDSAFGPSGGELARAQQVIMTKFQQLSTARSIQAEYLHSVIEHVDTALVCFDDQDQVEMINQAAKRLLRRKVVPSLDKIRTINADLADAIKNIRAGDQWVRKLVIDNEPRDLMLSASEFTLVGRGYKLVSLRNVQGVLQQQELESWRKLIRVISHELMNSMTPIVSLSRHTAGMLSDADEQKLGRLADRSSKEHVTLRRSLETIHLRSKGLVQFVQGYRRLGQLPQAIGEVEVMEFLQRLQLLLEQTLRERQVRLESRVAPGVGSLRADEQSLEQIMINLVYNALDALRGRDDGIIVIQVDRGDDGRAQVRVSDNGPGISEEHLEDVFTPFFSTKANSSGVGLSVSRQLAQLNNASLTVRSEKGEGSTFTLAFL